jgi:hypothetical protein
VRRPRFDPYCCVRSCWATLLTAGSFRRGERTFVAAPPESAMGRPSAAIAEGSCGNAKPPPGAGVAVVVDGP